jgi:hypothetical protein
VSDPSEAEFQKTVITLAKLHRWKVMHTQPAQIVQAVGSHPTQATKDSLISSWSIQVRGMHLCRIESHQRRR